MPIFAYRCDQCGFAKDVLQKRSDPPLTECPSCGKQEFRKQLAAPSFQLKGSGWYVTDFRDKGKQKAGEAAAAPSAGAAGEAAAAPAPAAAAAPAPAATGSTTPSSGDGGAKAA